MNRRAFGGTAAAVTVGAFDGVHRGHRQLLDHLLERAQALDLAPTLVTFDPHPLRIVRPGAAPQLLTTVREKTALLAELCIDHLLVLRFDADLASYTPRRFVERILVDRLGVGHLVIGYDHAFGRNRSGDAATLRRIGAELGFGVDVVGPVLGTDTEPVSSTRIRNAVAAGNVAAAAAGLGRPYTMHATVVRGDGRGRTLGFPTANLRVDDPAKLVPAPGIYAVRADLPGQLASGVLHIGPRPTFPGATPSIELFVLDFNGDLYGRDVRVRFCERLRDVRAFDDAGALVRAMEADCAAARRVFDDGAGACEHGSQQLQ